VVRVFDFGLNQMLKQVQHDRKRESLREQKQPDTPSSSPSKGEGVVSFSSLESVEIFRYFSVLLKGNL